MVKKFDDYISEEKVTSKISSEKFKQMSDVPDFDFEKEYGKKYITQIINLANNNAQGTRPKSMGKLSDLIQEFGEGSLEDWVEWYNNKYPGKVDEAVDKIYNMVLQMKETVDLIVDANNGKKIIKNWVEDLVYNKTYRGLKFQQIILKFIAEKYNQEWRLATADEESKGYDGFIGKEGNGFFVQIKSTTYIEKGKLLHDDIEVPIIYYEKLSGGYQITYDNNKFNILCDAINDAI